MRRIAIVTVTAFLLLASTICHAERNVITFGFATPLSGIFSNGGRLVLNAYKLWAEKVNQEGGIPIREKRYKVKLVYYDDRSNPGVSAKLVEKLITDDRVDLLLGGFGSSQVFAASAVAEKYGYPMISGAASSNRLFERGFKYYFSTLGKATEEVRGCVELLKTLKPRPKTIAILGANILFTSLACQGFAKYARKCGFRVIHLELFPISLQDYNSMLMKIKRRKPDVLLVGSHTLVAIKMVKALKETNFSPKLVAFSYGPTVPDFVKALGKDAEYMVGASEWTPALPYKDPVFGSAKEFAELYKKRFGRRPDYVEAATAAGAIAQQMAIESLRLAPPYDRKKRAMIMRWLHENEVDTFYGKIRFGKDGANISHPPIAVQIQNGKVVAVFPEDVREAPVIYPMPPWSARKR